MKQQSKEIRRRWLALSLVLLGGLTMQCPAVHAESLTPPETDVMQAAGSVEPSPPSSADQTASQEADAAPAKTAGDDGQAAFIEEIIVTAQKRSQNLQDVPIAITALTADALESQGITSSDDLPVVTPGLTIGQQISSAVTFIRGVGTSNAQVGSEASVAMYIDGIYSPFASANIFNFNNIERIEVLKGPQGTLFGRNSAGGLINVITANPEHAPSLQAKIGYGRFDTWTSSLYGTTGVTENLAADIAVYYQDQRNNYLNNPFLGQDYRPNHDVSVRSKWLYTPTADTQLWVSAFNIKAEGSMGSARQPAPGTFGLGNQPYSGDYYSLPSDVDTWWETDAQGASARLNHELDGVTFVSLTGWRDDEQTYSHTPDSVVAVGVEALGTMYSENFSQEFQLVSSKDSAFTWLAGVYYYENQAGYDNYVLKIPGSPGSPIAVNSEQKTQSYAVFSEGRYQFSDSTGATLGLRYSADRLDLDGITYVTPNRVALPYSSSIDFEEPTWRITLDHKLGARSLAYTTFSRGYKMGFYNLLVASGTPEAPVDPEILDAVEIGVKNELFDRRMRLNLAAFQYDYRDMQLTTVVPPTTRNQNAGQSTIRGAEAEGQWFATERLSFQFGLALLDAKFDEFLNGPVNTPKPGGGNTAGSADLEGKHLPRAPKFTLSGGIAYTLPTAAGDMEVSLAYLHNDGFYWEPESRLQQGAYDIVNAELSWKLPGERYKISLWGKNLLDEEYAIYGASSTSGDLIAPAEPLTYGIALEASFQ